MRKFFHRGPIKSIEVGSFKQLGLFLERGHYENDEIVFEIGLFFRTIWLKLNASINTIKIHNDLGYSDGRVEYRQRSFGIMITQDKIELGYGKPGDYINSQTKISFRYSRILTTLFGKEKYWDDEKDPKNIIHEGSILLPSYQDLTVTVKKNFTYVYVTRNCKRWIFPTKTWKTTSIDSQPIEHPGKGTTSYNCGDDATHGWSVPGHLTYAQIHRLIAGDCYYSRARNPI